MKSIMKKKKSKIAALAIGIAIIGMLSFSVPLMAAAQHSDEKPTAVEETAINQDADNVQEEINDADEVGDVDKAGDIEDADEVGQEEKDEKAEDENLPGGGHEDSDGVEVDHQFEGVE